MSGRGMRASTRLLHWPHNSRPNSMKIFFPPSAAAAWASLHWVCQARVPWSLKWGCALSSLMSLVFGPKSIGSARNLETLDSCTEDHHEMCQMNPLQRLPLALAMLAASCGGSEPEVGQIPGQPDIILVTVDTLRADHLGCYGYFRETSSTLDALSEESLLFERCIAPMATTLPCHLSLFTGLWPH